MEYQRDEQQSKMVYIVQIIDLAVYLLLKIVILVYYLNNENQDQLYNFLMGACIATSFYFIIKFVIISIKQWIESTLSNEIVKLVFKLFMVYCFLIIYTKVQVNKQLNWNYLILPFIIYSIAIFLANIGCLFLGIFKIYQKTTNQKDVGNYEIIGHFWLFLVSIGLSINFFVFMIGIYFKLENNGQNEKLVTFVHYQLIYMIILSLYYIIWKQDINYFQFKMSSYEEEQLDDQDESQSNHMNTDNDIQQSEKKKRLQVKKRRNQNRIIQKLTSTYFKAVQKKIDQTLNQSIMDVQNQSKHLQMPQIPLFKKNLQSTVAQRQGYQEELEIDDNQQKIGNKSFNHEADFQEFYNSVQHDIIDFQTKSPLQKQKSQQKTQDQFIQNSDQIQNSSPVNSYKKMAQEVQVKLNTLLTSPITKEILEKQKEKSPYSKSSEKNNYQKYYSDKKQKNKRISQFDISQFKQFKMSKNDKSFQLQDNQFLNLNIDNNVNKQKNNNEQNDQDKQCANKNDNEQIQEEPCLVCFDNEPNAVNMPCGHGGICYECALDLLQKKEECFLCRDKLTEVFQIEQDAQNNGNFKIMASVQMVNESFVDPDQTQLDKEDEILNLKDQNMQILKLVQAPQSLCDLQDNCEYCVQNSECIWCTQLQKCVVGSENEGAYFCPDCQFYLSESCTQNVQQVENQYLTKQEVDLNMQQNVDGEQYLDFNKKNQDGKYWLQTLPQPTQQKIEDIYNDDDIKLEKESQNQTYQENSNKKQDININENENEKQNGLNQNNEEIKQENKKQNNIQEIGENNEVQLDLTDLQNQETSIIDFIKNIQD